MGQWYCVVGGDRHGPIPEDVLRTWIREGRVARTDYVWADGMADWVPAGSVPGLFEGAPTPTGREGAMPLVVPPGGTGGGTPNEQLNAQVRERLRGHWGIAIGFCVLFLLISMVVQMFPYGLAWLILAGPMELGMAIFFLTLSRGGAGQIGMLFAGFKNFGNALCAYLLRYLFVLLWCLGFAIPGFILGLVVGKVAAGMVFDEAMVVALVLGAISGTIASVVASLAYSQTLYLIADEPGLGPMNAVRRSKRMMERFKGKLFCLHLRYFCWGLLCLLTCGIGFLFLSPYVGAGLARFYDDLRRPADAAQLLPGATPGSPTPGS